MNLPLPASLTTLPVLALAEDITQALTSGNVLLSAEPGAGKSTGLPLALLLDTALEGRIVLLEPRRLAARAVAERLASHLGEKVGQRIGLRMRSDTRVSSQTRLEVVTEGVLTRLLQDDPMLSGIALVIFDEFHERSLHADLGLALCLEVQRALRDDMRLLVMSATLATDQLHKLLGGVRQFDCTVRQHPVEVIWDSTQSGQLPQRIVRCVCQAIQTHTGDVLVFLPGVAEINRTANLLKSQLDPAVTVHRLHGGVGPAAQAKAIAAASGSHRRVILATSLAETSITIDGVRVVVDSGLERRGRMDGNTGAQMLETVMASQASASQRAGRAGRTAPGVCYRLWSESGHSRRPAHWQAEIHRADLAPLLMELGLWGASDGQDLPWLEPPPSASLARAAALLTRLGLWEDNQLTRRGRVVATLPVHPRIGHMLLYAAESGVPGLACRLAIWLDEQLHRVESVDLEPLLDATLASSAQRRMDQLHRLLNHAVRKLGESLSSASTSGATSNAVPADASKHAQAQAQAQAPTAAVLLARAYPDWIAQRRPGEAGRFLLACGAGAIIDGSDPLAHCPWLVVAQLGGAATQARIFKAMKLDIDELQRLVPELFVSIEFLDWDDRQQRVLAEQRVMMGSLIVDAQPLQSISDEARATALAAGIRRRGATCLPWTDECREWQARVRRMRELSTPASVGEFPVVDDEVLIERLDDWLMPWLQGIGSIKALQQLDLLRALNVLLDYPQQSLMEDWLPRRYTVPSGSQKQLSYTQPGNPVLSVRLQEMLGCVDNPSLANGQVPLKVELLSPAHRPVQITEDLANFWITSYPAVKKEMKGRYPKHIWPDDPLTAKPTGQAKRRK